MIANGTIIGRLIVGCALACSLSQNNYAQIPPGGGGTNYGGTNTYYSPPDISNYLKYQAQSFLVLDTNAVAGSDTNLFNALSSFSDDSGANPVLQVMPYGNNCLLFKASHFDYSGESSRDFCLAVCDKVETSLYKTIDISNPSNNVQNGGWLVQGSVPNWQVSDPMFLMVSNTSRIYNGFFRAVPYGGPQVTLTGYNPNDVVSNTVSLQATITDLSGVTNEQISINIDGADARYSIGQSNVIDFETKYNPDGVANIFLNAANSARIFDPTNPPDNSKIFFSSTGTIPLDFENPQFLAFASNWCPPEAGTNYIYYFLAEDQPVTCTISSPDDGRIVASFSGDAPAGYVAIPWNMTEADGITAYSNDAYVVTFNAFDPDTWVSTNSLDKGGNIRSPAGCFLTYEWEDPSTPTGMFLNNHADNAIAGDLLFLYQDIYDFFGITQYFISDVGPNRDLALCRPYNAPYKSFQDIMANGITNSATFSELTIAQAHGSGASIGGGPYLSDKFYSGDLQKWTTYCETPHNWRLRKACLFTCYNADLSLSTGGGLYSSWPAACGIRDTGFQQTSLTYKNCGLFFVGELPQGFQNAETSAFQATADVADMVDTTWVCGANQYPGGCDPTYSFEFAVRASMGVYPDLAKATPAIAGFPLCVYNANEDEALRNLDTSGVKTR
jgi:hypothetical protein